ncbi:MAG: hypothetical protein ABI847_08230 [Anaerolineales bacterium]
MNNYSAPAMNTRRRIVQLTALGLGLAGYWLPWLSAPPAALRLNGYELSEWVTYLPGVRDGSLPLSRLVFLLPLACLAILLALAASRTAVAPPIYILGGEPQRPRALPTRPRSGLSALLPVDGLSGWALLALGLLCALIVIPPYPYVLTAYADPEYRVQFFVALFSLVALLLALYLPDQVKAIAQLGLAAAGGVLGLWSLLALRPVASDLLGSPWPIGLGWGLMLAGFAILAWVGLAQLFSPRA